ncbi:hypothetical protein CRG98_046370 [Punica granatum]|uniref:Uncharacterized protein n=1 Tax=Punica granatum TaxID=22663 RepID=A0A2I0HND2_PUNGR|nr:hypothetical protein CRG98_046370 [Punica granatum]
MASNNILPRGHCPLNHSPPSHGLSFRRSLLSSRLSSGSRYSTAQSSLSRPSPFAGEGVWYDTDRRGRRRRSGWRCRKKRSWAGVAAWKEER